MFLDARLPQRDAVARAWARQAEAAPWSGIETDPDCRRQFGSAVEIRIGPDAALTPGYRDVLSFLPPEECRALLSAAGYSADGREDLADTGTTDPLLPDWRRVSHPIACGDDQQAVLTGCWDAAGMRRSRTEWMPPSVAPVPARPRTRGHAPDRATQGPVGACLGARQS